MADEWLRLPCGKRIKAVNHRWRFRIMLACGDKMLSAGRRRSYYEAVEFLMGQDKGGYVVDEPTGDILKMKLAKGAA